MPVSLWFRIINIGEENSYLTGLCDLCSLNLFCCLLQRFFLIRRLLIQEQGMSCTTPSGRMIVPFINVLGIYRIPIGTILWLNPRNGWSCIYLLLLKAKMILQRSATHHKKTPSDQYFLLDQKNVSKKRDCFPICKVTLPYHSSSLKASSQLLTILGTGHAPSLSANPRDSRCPKADCASESRYMI